MLIKMTPKEKKRCKKLYQEIKKSEKKIEALITKHKVIFEEQWEKIWETLKHNEGFCDSYEEFQEHGSLTINDVTGVVKYHSKQQENDHRSATVQAFEAAVKETAKKIFGQGTHVEMGHMPMDDDDDDKIIH